MPYIRQDFKSFLSTKAVAEVGDLCTTPGELNFVISTIVRDYFRRTDKGNYQAINDIVGALEGAKIEFYRRVAAPYEDLKIQENGDVY
jgi:hypothetical protein